MNIQIIPILNKPGKFIVAVQYPGSTLIVPSDNDGAGFTEDEAFAFSDKLRGVPEK